MLKALLDAYRKHALYRSTHKALSRLSDRELSDLGIHRMMITRISMEAAYGDEPEKNRFTISSLFKTKTEKDRIEEYLAGSANTVDLENRLKEIDRGLAPWQVRAKHFAQGWAQ